MSVRAALVTVAAAAVLCLASCGSNDNGGSASSGSATGTTPAPYKPTKQPPHARPEAKPRRYSGPAVARAIRTQPGTSKSITRPKMVVCRRETEVERRLVTDFGRTTAPIFRCDMDIEQVPYSMHVQVLPNGCFVGHAIDAKQALQGCGVRG